MIIMMLIILVLDVCFIVKLVSIFRGNNADINKSDFQVDFENRCIEAIRGKEAELHNTINLSDVVEEVNRQTSGDVGFAFFDEDII